MTNNVSVTEISQYYQSKVPRVLERCEKLFNSRIQEKIDIINYMNANMEFKFGQVVEIVSHTTMANILGINGQYGIIVGHRFFEEPHDDRQYYRVYESDRNPYIGEMPNCIRKVDSWDNVPEEFKQYKIKMYFDQCSYMPMTIQTFI